MRLKESIIETKKSLSEETKHKLTFSEFANIPAGEVFLSGTTTDDANGANMTNSGRKLKWVAKKGEANDWCIYIHWATSSDSYIESNGDKVADKENIKRLVVCDDQVMNRYRF